MCLRYIYSTSFRCLLSSNFLRAKGSIASLSTTPSSFILSSLQQYPFSAGNVAKELPIYHRPHSIKSPTLARAIINPECRLSPAFSHPPRKPLFVAKGAAGDRRILSAPENPEESLETGLVGLGLVGDSARRLLGHFQE